MEVDGIGFWSLRSCLLCTNGCLRQLRSCKDNKLERKQNKKDIQSTLVISKPKGPSETLLDIRTSTYQICRIEENTNRTAKFHK